MSSTSTAKDTSSQHRCADSSEVALAAALARAHGRLGIDTEFMSEGHYRPLLCMTQVAVEDEQAPSGTRTLLIDGLDRDVDVAPLAELLSDPDIQVVLHAGHQDVTILRHSWRTTPTNIFDTQIAAGFAGEGAQMGYGNLLASVLGIHASKTASYTRWDARPLTAEQLHYAAEDVEHLLALADALQERLTEIGRHQWAIEECRRLETVTDGHDPDRAWQLLPRVGRLDPRTRAVARRLAAWRERTAEREDRPVGQLVQDPTLIELARRRPADARELGQIRGMHSATIKRRGDELLQAIAEGQGDPPIPHEPRRAVSEPADTPLVALCEAIVRSRALQAHIAYELVASRAELEQIVRAARRGETEPDVRPLAGWRRKLVGTDLQDLLAGRVVLGVDGGGLQITGTD